MTNSKFQIIENQISMMLNLQDEINIKIDPAWSTRCRPWYRAIWIEVGEMMDHIGYKWWKAQSIDIDQVQLEIVDIWHFALSIYYEEGTSERDIARIFESDLLDVPEIAYQAAMLNACEEFVAAVLRRTTFPMINFIGLMNVAGMSMDDLYRQYVGKNVLNTFRQDHGYKDGTYIKDWDGEEDNVVLSRIVDSLDTSDPNYPWTLRLLLDNEYESVMANARQ